MKEISRRDFVAATAGAATFKGGEFFGSIVFQDFNNTNLDTEKIKKYSKAINIEAEQVFELIKTMQKIPTGELALNVKKGGVAITNKENQMEIQFYKYNSNFKRQITA